MKRCLSVLTPATRLSVWKVLLLSALTVGVQILLFLAAFWGWGSTEHITPSLEETVRVSGLSLAFAAGLVLVCAVLVLPGTERGAKTGYTLRRLAVDERVIVMLWGGVNALLLLLFWGVQTAAALALARYYLHTLPAEFSNHQSLFFAFSRAPYLHALLPMWDWGLTVRNVLGCAVLGLSIAALPFHWRHGRKAWSTFPLVILAAFTFPCGMDGSAAYGVQLIILCMTGILTTFGVWRRHEDEE
ncbi:hypothetical protein [Pseudoflavonifractor phocaeensis]|uniref:hypothetical protein n=1 Tax=Pseudoflavonifractor phocaeensis TaxID=1870988 RepID=UPI00195622DC|nr:hypothetical protein [Pseudoflavonifractor phocaeensis]MBM6725070.1 hypothetical protein [Pseudoflavonifractor phocaeensis]